MDSNEKKDKIDWDAPTEAATLSQIEGEMEILRDLVSLMENDAKPLEDGKEKGITLLYEYMGQLFLLHSEVEKLTQAEEDYDMAMEPFFNAKERCEELAESLEPAQIHVDDCKIRLEEAKENLENTMGELSEEPEDDNFDEAAATESEAAAESSVAAEEAVVEAENDIDEALSELEDRKQLVEDAEEEMYVEEEHFDYFVGVLDSGKDAIVNKLEPLAKKINKLIDEYWGIDPTSIRRATGKEVWEKFEKQRGKDVPTSYKPDDALEYKTPTTSPSKLQEKATEVKKKLEDLSNKEKETKGLILPDPVLQEEQTMITTLEINFRKLVEIVFKDIPRWWDELVPDYVRENARYKNNRDPAFLKWDQTQDFKLLEKLNFRSLSQIFTGVKCWKHFSSVFPRPEGENSDMMWSIKPKLRETCYYRNRVDHSIRLKGFHHNLLKAYHDYFMDCLKTFFENKNV